MYWDICAEYLLVTLRQSGAFPQFRDNGSIASVKAKMEGVVINPFYLALAAILYQQIV